MAQGVGERRRAPRAEVAVDCTLRRRHGTPISCRTVELGPGGMSVASQRPLATDELLRFDLAGDEGLQGEARVLRQRAHQVYVLRFEHLQDAVRARLERFAGG